MTTTHTTFTIIDSRSINDLFRDIRKYDVLSNQQTNQLAQQAAQGDQKAFNKLFCSNLRIVITIAKHFTNCSRVLELQDLFQAGCLGLMKAIENYDPTRGITLCSMASAYIRNAIRDLVRKHGCAINIPSSQWETCKETYSELRLSDARNDDGLSWEETLNINDHSMDADSLIRKEDKTHAIQLMLNKLNPKEQAVLRYHFGLNGREMQAWEIAETMHLTEARINQIINEALTKLRKTYAPKHHLTTSQTQAHQQPIAA